MSDSFTEITTQGWLQRLVGSFVGALFGIVLFFASFVVLYWNEGHAVAEMTSLNNGARTVVSVPATAIDPSHEGKLVHVAGDTSLTGPASDPLFHVAPANAIRLKRHVESFQWQEHEETQTEKHLGGSETKRTTYTYNKVWSDRVIDSSKFKQPGGHANPALPFRTAVFDAKTVNLGSFRLDSSVVDKLGAFKALSPPGSAANPPFQRTGDQFYRGANEQSPDVGDMRVSYEVVETQPISVVGAQVGQTLTQFRGQDGRVIELVDPGIHSADDLFHEAKASANVFTWVLRGVGFAMMVIGLALLSAPLSWLASVVPFMSDLVDGAAVLIALVLAIPLTLITIAIAWIVHRPLLGAGLLVAGLAAGALVRWLAPRRRPTPAPFAPAAMR